MEHNHECGCGGAKIETCGCDHCHEHGEESKLPLVAVIAGAVLIGVSFLPFLGETVKIILQLAATVICGIPTFISAAKSAVRLKINESLLLVIAVIAAVILGEFFEAAMLSVLFRAGELMEDYASDRSRKSVEAIFGIVSDEANLLMPDGTLKKVDADDVEIGDIIAVLPYETVPVDGIVINGEGSVDASALTGEAVPVQVEKGSSVSSGMCNGSNTLQIRATAVKCQSSAARIAEMVEQAAQKKGNAQRAVATFAKYYTPAVVGAAVLLAVVPSLITGDWREWIYKSLLVLVASCPCAVVISAPLAFFSSMGAAAKNGIIIKGSRYIEALAKSDTVAFDKTGTLTTGELKVGKIYTADGFLSDDVISLAAKCEFYSSHPIAKAIVACSGEVNESELKDFAEIAGGGTTVTAAEGNIICGSERFMKKCGADISDFPKAPVYVVLNGKCVGAVEIDGEIREESPNAVKKLRKLGVEHSLILTGDSAEQARKVCTKCGIDDFRSGLLPEDKLTALEEIKDGANGVVYVGDGINDAPVLAESDVGIAMGQGTQAACEAADIILVNSNLSRLCDTVYLSKRTMNVLKTNIAFAIAVKAIVIILGIAGVAPMWTAVLADVGTMIISVANAARLLKVKRY